MVVDARQIWLVKAGDICYRLYIFGFEGIVSNMRFDLKLKMQIRFYFLNIDPYSMSILGRAFFDRVYFFVFEGVVSNSHSGSKLQIKIRFHF